jgi:uncharacterized protein (TIGR04255 family)
MLSLTRGGALVSIKLVSRRVDFGERAPIVEALLDARVSPREGIDALALKSFGDGLEERFPTCQIQTHWQSQLNFSSSQIDLDPESVTTSTLGYAFLAPNGSRIAQAQIGGFCFSKLQPYEGWDALLGEFQELWQVYLQVAQPSSISRVAVRYINKILLPIEFIANPSVYLGFHPSSPDGLGNQAEFFTRSVVCHPQRPDIRGVITVASESSTEDSFLIYDIDVFAGGLALDPDSQELPALLDQLREYKNDLFFGAITPLLEEKLS